jgi:hypothetical protein
MNSRLKWLLIAAAVYAGFRVLAHFLEYGLR